MNTEPDTSPLIRWKRWSFLGALVGGGILLVALDGRLKHSDVQGYALSQPEWQISCDNVGYAWQSFMGTPSWEALVSEGDPTRDFLVDFRKAMGIRLTPNRWSTWFSSSAVLSGQGDDWLLVTKPGVLARGLDMGNRLVGAKESENVRVYNNQVYYRWENGWLWCSNSRSFLAELQPTDLVEKSLVGIDEFVKLEGGGIIAVLDLSSEIGSQWITNQPDTNLSSVIPFEFFQPLHELKPDWEEYGERFSVYFELEEHLTSLATKE